MATLSAVGFTAAAGICGFSVSMISFGFALSKQSPLIAARCIARPRTVIYNPNPDHECQNRGNTFWGWVPWVMNLTYATMLSGVPGTGTRDNGLTGLMLKVNLDGIILIRFHHLCFRVSCFATILYILIVLPIFKTAQCDRIGGDFNSQTCIDQNATDYHRFTIANIPPLSENIMEDAGVIGFFIRTNGSMVLIRLYMVVFVSWIINVYTYKLLEKEWRDVLALRRVYFLETDHWSDRNAELEETLLREERENKNESMNDVNGNLESAKHYAKTRDPWVHHPEQRDTVPNIELYSILVGGLPSLPTEAFVQKDVKTVFSRKQSIDWQLAVTSAFFDHCVPNQPGFSSSVAAVTILPTASQITEAWKHWYNTAAKVRKLRFIRKQISKYRKKRDVDFGNESVKPSSKRSFHSKLKKKDKKKKKKKRTYTSSIYDESDEKKKYYSEVLGNTDDLDVEKNLLHALKLGPEQTAVYSREFALGAANVAPYGWNESKVRNSSLSELLQMEKDAISAVQEASHALREVQERIAEDDINDKNRNDDTLTDLMVTATIRSVDAGSQDYDKITNDNHEMKRESMSSKIRSLLNFSIRKTSVVDVTQHTGDYNQGSMCNTLDGSSASRHSSLRKNGTVSSSLDQSQRISGTTAIENKNSITQGSIPSGRKFFGKNTPSMVSNSAKGLDDLGLEAGLFLEQRNSKHSHLPRNLLTRARSAEDISQLFDDESEKGQPASFRRMNSFDDIDTLKELVKEGKMSLEIDTEDVESDTSSILDQTDQEQEKSRPEGIPLFSRKIIKDKTKEEIEYESLGYEPMESYDAGVDSRTSGASSSNSIWDRIANENNRRNEIRKRLDTLSKSNDEGKIPEKRRISFSNAEANRTLNNNSTSNVVPAPKAESNSQRHMTDSRMFSIDESSNKSQKVFEFDASTRSAYRPSSMKSITPMTEQDVRLTYAFEEKAGLRRRQGNISVDRLSQKISEKWSKVVQIANESSSRRNKEGVDRIESGSFSIFEFHSIFDHLMVNLKNTFDISKWKNHSADMVDPFDLVGECTFAVVTFTSRQAAVAARYCLADSRGADRWNTVSEIPSPPLADAPVCNLLSFRGFVRPVTISINDRQKLVRHLLALAMLGTIYIFYILPLTSVQDWLSPTKLKGILPNLESWLENDFALYIFSGFIPAMIWTGFYGVCPPLFKVIANFGSNATSAACAEGSALRYFWWFMIVSAFTGTSLATAVLKGFNDGELDLGSSFQAAIVSAASTIPRTVSATWLNWIIVRALLVLPTQYILQMNTYLLSWFRLKACARAVQGGGSGGPIPYRIYVDSGVVMLCLLALAPASPLIAIAAFIYFLISVPMLRWVLIFLYKPKFDIGGARFPFIFDMCVSGMIAGQSLLGTMLLIRKAYGPAVVAFMPLIPTIFYRWVLLKRYLKAFTDVALLQTSLLDGWDTNEETSVQKREEFRQFLVDCHKAAYVPVCIASDEATVISSEPAVVVPLETDAYDEEDDETSVITESYSMNGRDFESVRSIRATEHQTLYHPYEPQKQFGRMMRRLSSGPANCNSSSPFDECVSPKSWRNKSIL